VISNVAPTLVKTLQTQRPRSQALVLLTGSDMR
jgi:hypothetical protein